MKKQLSFPWLFGIELIPWLFVPFVIWWSNTPTNVLNASTYGEILEFVGILGLFIISGYLLPTGIAGLVLLKKQNKLRVTTKIVSIVNLSLGTLFGLGMLLGILVVAYLMVFKGYSV